MNRTVNTFAPGSFNDESEDEGNMTILEIHEKNYYLDKYARKNRWVSKIEREEERTSNLANVASNRASSCS